jgi:sugar phosphate isomerase/epimerase
MADKGYARTPWLRRIGPVLAAAALMLTSAAAHARGEYGAQLYTVRAAMAQDVDATLTRVAAMGYREVEFAGLFGRDPAAVRATLKRLKLKAVASHVDWKGLRDDPDAMIAQTRALGARYMVLAWLPPEERQTLAQWRWWIAHMNHVAAKARASGLRFAYHAHDFEYHAIDGVRPIDLMLADTDARTVQFEIDIYWTVKGGDDPIALVGKYPGRFPLAHLKDMRAADSGMADLGDGKIDIAAFLKAARRAGLKHAFVERDDAPDPLASLAHSLTYWTSIEGKK